MSLANVAASLASEGRRVLMIDFDLEAPGLDSFDEFKVPKGRVGLVEYVCHYLQNGVAAAVNDYIHEVKKLDLVDSDSPCSVSSEGKLWLMTSGAKNDAYNERRLSIDWADLYESREGANFFENLKAEIEDVYRPDYVLVDSRTGLTDVGGVCTLHLPDLVVLLFSLNEQNLQGIASVARVLRDSEKYPQIIPVATPVPNISVSTGDGETLLDQRFQRAKELLGAEVKLTLPYSSVVALKERILVWGQRKTLLCHQYGELADAIQKANPDGLDFLVREAEDALQSLEMDRVLEIGEILKAEYSDRSDSWLVLANLAQALGESEEMESALFKALEIAPDNLTASHRVEGLLTTQGRNDELLDLINQRIKRANGRSSKSLRSMHVSRGELYMKLGNAVLAEADYKKAFALLDSDDPESTLGLKFNLAEADRRSNGVVNPKKWIGVVQTFEAISSGVSSLAAPLRANQTQAMHIAYACIGNIEKASSLLNETEKVLKHASSQERVFSVAEYEHLPLSKFQKINQEMRDALDRGELWDGMKLD